jgi:hypothetical protein
MALRGARAAWWGCARLNEGRTQLSEGRVRFCEGRTQLSEGRARLPEGRIQLSLRRSRLLEGQISPLGLLVLFTYMM